MPNENRIYLHTYMLQRDMRIRLPKQILSNMKIEKGSALFDIFFNPKDNELVLALVQEKQKQMTKK